MKIRDEVVKIITERIKMNSCRVFFFGSRVNGTENCRSDIDIGIEAETEVPLDIMNEIKSELDNLPILQKIDVVDFKMVSEEFKKTAMRKIEVIYER